MIWGGDVGDKHTKETETHIRTHTEPVTTIIIIIIIIMSQIQSSDNGNFKLTYVRRTVRVDVSFHMTNGCETEWGRRKWMWIMNVRPQASAIIIVMIPSESRWECRR